MQPNKNIDRLFQEKLKDLEVRPPDIVWDSIEKQLGNKKKRRLIPIWLRYGSVAALLILFTVIGVNYFTTPNTTPVIDNSITDTDSNQTPAPVLENEKELNAEESIIVSTNTDEKDVTPEKTVVEKEESLVESNERSNQIANSNQKTKENITETTIAESPENSIAQEQKSTENFEIEKSTSVEDEKIANTTDDNVETVKEPISKNDSEKEEVENAVAYENIENLEDTLENPLMEEVADEQQTPDKRWTVASVVAPVFYNSFSTQGAPLDLQFQNNPKEGSQSVSYGVRVGFAINKKFTIQSGVTMMDVGYTVGEVYIDPSPQAAARLANVNYTNTGTILNVNASNNITTQSVIETGAVAEPITGDLNQDYGYIEVPLEMKYNLSNGKLGVHLVAGFSTLFLNSNEVYVDTNEFSSNLGEANNLNSVNFSGNFGMDLDYFINKNLFINVNPMLKVHTNTFTENIQNFEPYVIGIYTGLNYRF